MVSQFLGVHQIRIGVTVTEVFQRHAVDHRASRCAQTLFEDFTGIGAGHCVHGVEAHPKTGLEQRADPLEVEQLFHQIGVVAHRIDDFHLHVANLGGSDLVQVDVRSVQHTIAVDVQGGRVNGLRHFFRGRSTIRGVELDAEILVRPAGIVTGRKDDATTGVVLADHVGNRGSGENAALTQQDPPAAVGGGDAQDFLNRLPVVIATVAADHQRCVLVAILGVENALHEIFQVVRFFEHLDFLA